jgi:CubicO group peptidase (beta-lactamase class C family)
MQAISTLLSELVAKNETPGVVAALFQGDRTIWSGAAGVGDVAAARPLTVTTKARVASVSKIATALTLIQLAEEGLVDLDSDASPALGFTLRHPRHPDAPITPRMILSHTSGVRDASTYRGVVGETLEGFFVPGGERWADGEHWAAREAPLGHFTYSNLGMGLIAQMAERAGKERFDRLAKRLVFDPLGIDCGFNWSGVPEAAVAVASPLYRRPTAGGPWTVQVDGDLAVVTRPTHAVKPGLTLDDYVVGANGLIFAPQGGLRASVMDLVAIGMGLTGARPLLEAGTRAALARPVWTHDPARDNGDTSGGAFQGFGTGVHWLLPGEGCPIAGLKRPMIGHYGDAYGLLAGLWVDPETRAGFAWFATGSPQAPAKGARSGVYAIEETMMQALSSALDLA